MFEVAVGSQQRRIRGLRGSDDPRVVGVQLARAAREHSGKSLHLDVGRENCLIVQINGDQIVKCVPKRCKLLLAPLVPIRNNEQLTVRHNADQRILLVNLRPLGMLREWSVNQIGCELAWYMRISLGLVILTGIPLFLSEAMKSYRSVICKLDGF